LISAFDLKEIRTMHLQVAIPLRDTKNLELLRLLQRDPRAAVADLARGVGMSAPAVRERLQRLEEAGIITGTTLELDAAALGYPVLAFVRLRPAPGQLQKIIDLAKRTPQVIECHRVTGEDCFVLKLRIAAIEQLDTVLDRFLAFGQTTTSIVQSTPVSPRALPLPDEAPGLRASA
jgi:Lrp/AsnC family leucine-responsive transcriptional regulator